MTIRKHWLIALSCIVVMSVLISSILFTGLTRKSYKDVINDRYDNNIIEMTNSIEQLLSQPDSQYSEIQRVLHAHLQDPIFRLEILSAEGEIQNIEEKQLPELQKGFDGKPEIQEISIYDGNTLLGTIRITKAGPPEALSINRFFDSELMTNALIAIGVALLITLIIGYMVSTKMTTALRKTAELANELQVGDSSIPANTNILEINMIRDILYDYNSRLKMKQQSRKALLDELVHQSRTPLTVLQIHLEGIEEGLMEATPEEMKTLINQIEQVTAVISNMSEMIDEEKEVQELVIEEFDFTHFIRQIHNGLTFQFKKKNIQLELELNQKVELHTDKHKLNQILYNLLTNAYKYTQRDGRVSISYTVDENQISISIKDTGVGISEEDLEKIFQAYYRAEKTKNISGEGIGLYIARENAKDLGGTISIESVLGEGSIFTLNIPTGSLNPHKE
mgnify:CR=1 FL=1